MAYSRCISLRPLLCGIRFGLLGLMLAFTAACVGTPDAPKRSIAKLSRPAPTFQRPNAQQCLAALGRQQIKFSPLPDQQFGGGCSAINSVKLLDIGTPVSNLGAMTCPLAANFAAWARYGAQPAARQILGSELVRIETMGTYACRKIVGMASNKLSEHAHSNAVDVAAFVLADGRRISVKGQWYASGPEAQFLRTVRASACKRFLTVLSPDYNAAHHDHMHFDMGGRGGFCR